MLKKKQPVQKRGYDKRDLILKTASHLFDTVGYHDVSTRTIAEEAKIPVASIYQFFRHKQDILDSIADEYSIIIDQLFQSLSQTSLPPNLTPRDIAKFFVDRVIEFDNVNPEFFTIFSFSNVNSDLNKAIEELDNKIVTYCGNLIQKLNPNFFIEKNYYKLLIQWKGALFLFIRYKALKDDSKRLLIYTDIVDHTAMYFSLFLNA